MSTRPLLMIPGPIEIEPDVAAAMGAPAMSHLDPAFIATFARTLAATRQLFGSASGQPFVVAGSGTFAMEMAVANAIEPDEEALVVVTGFFSDRMAKILERHGARVVRVEAAVGDAPSAEQVAKALEAHPNCKVMTITHVDTSTGVRAPVAEYARLAKSVGALVIVDGVCSAGGETLEMDAWQVDIAFTASQKAVGAPPGLALLVANADALARREARKSPMRVYYADFAEWRPIMQAYEAAKPSYFGTPAVQLVSALGASLARLHGEGVTARVARHERIGTACRAAWAAMGLQLVARRPELAANTLSAIYFPDGIDAGLVARVGAEGVIVAGGLHPEIRSRYFRVGHMGSTSIREVLASVGAIERVLHHSGWTAAGGGAGVRAAQETWARAGT